MDSNDSPDMGRRKALYSLGGILAAGIGGAVGADVWGVAKNLYSKAPQDAQKELLNGIFGEFTDMPSIFAGNGNKRAIFEGDKLLSVYMRNSSIAFNSYIAEAFNKKATEVTDEELFRYNPAQNHLFLGGPVSNEIIRKVSGYEIKEVFEGNKVIPLPVLNKQRSPLRWAFDLGDSGYGIYKGEKRECKRYEKGTLVTRPQYGLVDLHTSKTHFSDIDESGFLKSDFLTVVKLQDKSTGKYQFIIGGKHGYCTEAFSQDLNSNLENVLRVIKNRRLSGEFQLLIPAPLKHGKMLTGKHHTNAELDWKGLKYQALGK